MRTDDWKYKLYRGDTLWPQPQGKFSLQQSTGGPKLLQKTYYISGLKTSKAGQPGKSECEGNTFTKETEKGSPVPCVTSTTSQTLTPS